MARPTTKARLENGLRLDVNNLARRGIFQSDGATRSSALFWNSDYWGEIDRATITASLTSQFQGWLRVQTSNADQHIVLRAQARRFGGVQWYFICPFTGGYASVLWRPPGSQRFGSRQTWGRQVAYLSQCLGATDRAWRTMSKIKRRLIADLDPDEWHFPPKPKWMRWRTYRRYETWFDRHDAILDRQVCLAARRLLGVGK